MSDHRNPLTQLNINLFIVLDALLRHQSAARAAEELGVTPSAVSHSLRELRHIFGDELFVRGGSGLVPTARARTLGRPVREGLRVLEVAVTRQVTFDPGQVQRRFVLSTTDDIATSIVPAFVSRVMTEAPGITLEVHHRGGSATDLLGAESVDLVVHLSSMVPSWVGTQTLLTDDLSCLVRTAHPKVGDQLDLETYLSLPHVRVAPEGFGPSSVDLTLRDAGLHRRVAAYTSTFFAAAEIVARTDAVLTTPTRFARAMAARGAVRMHAPPLAIPEFTLEVMWHKGRCDEALAWLRDVLLDVAQFVA